MKKILKRFKVPFTFFFSLLISLSSYLLIHNFATPPGPIEEKAVMWCEFITLACAILATLGGLISAISSAYELLCQNYYD